MVWRIIPQICVFLSLVSRSYAWGADQTMLGYQRALHDAGDEMLENLAVSYAYGGSTVGDAKACEACNQCLEQKQPKPKQRFDFCPACHGCSLDCSHFSQLVYARAGLAHPYLTTEQMLTLNSQDLERKYQLVVVSSSAAHAIPGDLLVYKGHVVILEAIQKPGVGDVLHATGGRDIKEPGQGIQRERFAKLDAFRGELRRVLRHKSVEEARLAEMRRPFQKTDPKTGFRRLRPVEKKAKSSPE